MEIFDDIIKKNFSDLFVFFDDFEDEIYSNTEVIFFVIMILSIVTS